MKTEVFMTEGEGYFLCDIPELAEVDGLPPIAIR